MTQCIKQLTKRIFTGQYDGSIEHANYASFLPEEELIATLESSNNFDRYVIAAFKTQWGTIRPSVIGHLPWEISRFTYYVIVHGG